jgi:hypothetical protein
MNRTPLISIISSLILPLMLLVPSYGHAQDQERPFIWVKASDRPEILQKIGQNPWAKELFQTLQARADKATSDSLVKRRGKLMALPLVWSQDSNAAPTLVIMKGAGSVNTY